MTTEIVKAGGALAVRPDQTEWTPAQAAVLQQSGISNDVTAAELSGFLHLCQRTQLDPFSRQIYLIGRKDKRAGRVVFTPQTGIDGYRVVAHRAAAAAGEALGYEDTLWCGEDGRWRDVWLSSQPPAAAKVTVLRNGRRFSAVATFAEYAQLWDGKPSGLWGKMPAVMVAKCAEALALRKAFPHDLAGVYTAEEMAQADNQQPESGQQPRIVQPDEPDPWQTPAPQRDFVAEAAAANSLDAVRALWIAARAAGAPQDVLDAIAANAQKAASPETADDDIPDAEIVPDEPAQPEPATARQVQKVGILCGALQLTDRAEALEYVAGVIGHPIASRKELTKVEAKQLIDHMERAVAALQPAA